MNEAQETEKPVLGENPPNINDVVIVDKDHKAELLLQEAMRQIEEEVRKAEKALNDTQRHIQSINKTVIMLQAQRALLQELQEKLNK